MSAVLEYDITTSAPVEEIVELYKAGGWWHESPLARSRIEPMMRGSFCFMVARAGGKIVAMGRVISDGASDAYIQDIVVLPAFRRQGIGAELIRRLTRYCVEHRIEWIGLIAEPGTLAFYEKLGYGELVGFRPMLYGKRG
jgi:ribosomal protein S18 acetylase RimI-like enzyme